MNTAVLLTQVYLSRIGYLSYDLTRLNEELDDVEPTCV